jgi:hypothetical protein
VNEAELRAYGMVAQAIAQHAFAIAEAGKENESYFPEARGPVYYHYSMSIFEAVANDLWRLRILRPLDQKADWAFHFVFDCDVDQSNRVAERNWQSGPALFDVLVTFINLFGEYGTNWGFSAKPELVFGQNSRMAPTLDTLASIGLVTKLGNGFIWTEHIAPMMRASYHYEDWPEPASK